MVGTLVVDLMNGKTDMNPFVIMTLGLMLWFVGIITRTTSGWSALFSLALGSFLFAYGFVRFHYTPT
jgi:hypothetical protein